MKKIIKIVIFFKLKKNWGQIDCLKKKHLEFLSLKAGCASLYESTHVGNHMSQLIFDDYAFKIIKVPIRLGECACWSAPLLFPCKKDRLSLMETTNRSDNLSLYE